MSSTLIPAKGKFAAPVLGVSVVSLRTGLLLDQLHGVPHSKPREVAREFRTRKLDMLNSSQLRIQTSSGSGVNVCIFRHPNLGAVYISGSEAHN